MKKKMISPPRFLSTPQLSTWRAARKKEMIPHRRTPPHPFMLMMMLMRRMRKVRPRMMHPRTAAIILIIAVLLLAIFLQEAEGLGRAAPVIEAGLKEAAEAAMQSLEKEANSEEKLLQACDQNHVFLVSWLIHKSDQ